MAPLSVYISFFISSFMSFLSLFIGRLYTPQNPPTRDLSGQIAIVTGANTGIGLYLASGLAKQGATVYLACRNLTKAEAAREEIISKAGEKSRDRVLCWKLDVGDFDSVRAFCERWRRDGKKIDMLVHNAGITNPPAGTVPKTKEGLDQILATNFLGPFLMTQLLEGCLGKTARVVFTSSTAHYYGSTVLELPHETAKSQPGKLQAKLGLEATAPTYSLSKTQQVLFAHLLQRHFSSFPDNKRTAHSFSPSFSTSQVFSHLDINWRSILADLFFVILKVAEKWVAVDTEEGAKTGVWLASCGSEVEGGHFWERSVKLTSLIDYKRGVMGEAKFESACRGQWGQWCKDTGVEWDLES